MQPPSRNAYLYFVTAKVLPEIAHRTYTADQKQVPVTSGITTVESFVELARTSAPTIVTDFTSGWPASEWTLRTLRERFGKEEVNVRIGPYDTDRREVAMSLGSFIAHFVVGGRTIPDLPEGSLPPYVGNQIVPDAMRADLPVPAWLPMNLATMWIGPAGAISPLHAHCNSDTLLCQLIGRRRVTLIAPHHMPLIGFACVNANITWSAFDLSGSANPLFPGMSQVTQLQVDLEPGQTLLIPGFWYHHVRTLEPTVAISLFSHGFVGGYPIEEWRRRGSHTKFIMDDEPEGSEPAPTY